MSEPFHLMRGRMRLEATRRSLGLCTCVRSVSYTKVLELQYAHARGSLALSTVTIPKHDLQSKYVI